jgi:hypothetical protein
MTTKMIDPALVRLALANAGTEFVTVEFIKKDGTLRKINGLLRPASHIVGDTDASERTSAALAKHGNIPIYSMADRGWKCFHEARVVAVRTRNSQITGA